MKTARSETEKKAGKTQKAKMPKTACDVLIVDDDEFNLRVAGDILKEHYKIHTVQSGEEALAYMEERLPRLVLLDLHMPNMDGRETMKRIQSHAGWRKVPIIFLTSDTKPETEMECLVLGASDFITKPFVPMVMLSRISRIIELADLQNDLESRLEEKTRLVEKVSLNSIMVIANTIDAKDAYTSGHSMRVAKCCSAIARKLGWPEQEVQNIHYVGLLHDIGKIGVPDAILNKPGKLSDEEFRIIKKHPVIGNDILKDIRMIKNVAEGALYHHERYDGRGYPFGLAGDKIPYYARIIGIADAYDAMTSNRIYRHKLPSEKVVKEFERGRGTQFDPQLTDLFLEMLKNGFDVSKEKGDIIWDDDLASESSALLSKVLSEYAADAQKNAITDPLTGLYTRNYAEVQIEKYLGEARPGTFLMIDMDNFKYINDTYGHIAGDMTLRAFADVLKLNTGKDDVVCRLGGDEFIVFLTDMTSREEVSEKAENILKMLAANLKKLECNGISSVSIGMAVSPDDGRNFEALYNNADKALYYVKRNGKNAFTFYSEEKEKNSTLSTGTDLDHIRTMLEGRMDEPDSGIFKVEYADFQRLYTYISRGVKRNHQQVQTLLFTLTGDGSKKPETGFEESMRALELAAASSLRMVDVGTRYSSIQYIVILLDTDIENGKKVADRVVKKFYQMYGGRGVLVSFDIQTMQPHFNKDEPNG